MERIAEAPPRSKASMAVFQLLEALTATFGQVIIRAFSLGTRRSHFGANLEMTDRHNRTRRNYWQKKSSG
jgi:hypothetical protein